MIRILFVCHGNICRSPMAEFVMKELAKQADRDDLEIASAATSTEEIGNDIHIGTKRILEKYGIPFSMRRAVQLRYDDRDKYDLMIGMDRANIRNITRMIGENAPCDLRLLLSYTGQTRDVADPWYTGDFETTYRDIKQGCQALLESLPQPKTME